MISIVLPESDTADIVTADPLFSRPKEVEVTLELPESASLNGTVILFVPTLYSRFAESRIGP